MYSPGRGDARATAPPNARDSSTSMPIDHASAWQQREPYSRDVRLDRVDRDRIIGGKREWNSDRPSSGAPYQRAFGSLHPVNGSLGPPNKRRLNGRHSGFHTENGRYGSAGHRGESSPFGSISPLENGLARKFDRDFYPGSGCAVANTGFSNGPGLDHRSKDPEERHKRDSFPVSGDGRDGASSAVNDQPVRPYHSQVLSEVENSSWDRDRSKGLISSGSWDSSQRSERDHRERLSGKPDPYSSRREGKFSQYDAGRDWPQGDRDLDGSRLDRYGSSSRDGFSGDAKDSPLGFEWRRKERSSSVSASRASAYVSSNGSTKEKPQGLDVSGSAASPQHSPHSTPSSTVHEPSRDDGNHPSPPKRPRLGWGQGLAKYEKKKVVETDDVATPSPGVTVSESGRSVISADLSGTTTETVVTQEVHAAEESPVSVVSNPTTSPVLTPTIPPLQQALESVSKSTVESQIVEQDAVGKQNEKVEDEAEKPAAACSSLPCVVAEIVVKKTDVCAVTESICEVTARQPDSSESVDKPTVVKEPSSCQASPFSPSVIEQSSAVDLTQEVSSLEDVVGWTKEAILQRVEKVEAEIELVEKEISKSEKVESPNIVAHTEPLGEEVTVAKSEQADDGPQAMDEDDVEVSAPTRESRESSQLVHGASPTRTSLHTTECDLKIHGEGADEDVGHQLDIKSVEGDDRSMLDQAAVLEEGELHEEKKEQATVTSSVHDSESEGSLMSSPIADMELVPMNHLISVSRAEVEDKEESSTRMVLRDPQVIASTLMEENKMQALQASQSFMHLLTPDLSQGGTLYSCPSEALVWKENVESHDRNEEKLLEKLTENKQTQKFAERILTMRFRAFKDAWRQEQSVSQQQRGTKPVRRWELEKRNGTSLPCQRSSLRLRPVQSGTGKLEAVSEENMKKLMVEPVVGHLRPILKMPAMILGEKERLARRFESKNALVEDPVQVELERKTMNPWTVEEKKTFLEKFAVYNKNFSKIASHLEYKTTADCVEFYYRNQKSEDFEKIRRRQQLKKRRDYSRVGGSYLATGLPTSSRQREANANARAAYLSGQTAASVVTVSHISAGAKAVRSSIHHKPADRIRISSSIDPASLPPALELGKSLNGKENKHSVTPPVSTSAAVLTSTVAAAATSVTVSCGLSSAIAPVKISRERSAVKSMSYGGQVVARNGLVEQHTSGPKGARSIHIRRDLAKSAGEEADAQWTDRERELFTDAVAMFGKDFQSIALHVGPTKSLGQCKSFFSKTRKRLGLDHLVEKYQAKQRSIAGAVVVKNSECADVQMEEVLPAVSEDPLPASLKVDSASVPMEEENRGNKSPEHDEHEDHDEHDELEEEIANALKLSDSKATDEEASEPVATVVVSEDVKIETSVCLKESPAEIENVAKAECEVTAIALTMEDCRLEEPVDSIPECVVPELVHEEEQVRLQLLKVEEPDTGSEETTSVAGSGVLEEEVAREAAKIAESVVESPNCESETIAGNDVGALVKVPKIVADRQEPKFIPAVAVKPEPGSPQVAMSASTDSASFPSVPATMSHSAGAIFSTTSSIHSAQQARERVGRVGSGETKPRREPTSWTQEEKEKFADIIRNHGKDWSRLHDCLPAKSLTQIKTYFQNSKAKLGLLNPEALNISGGRGAGSRKRKADDSDTTSSNNVGSLTTASEFKSSSILPPDADVVSQKVSPAMSALPGITAAMSMGTSPVGTDSLPYPVFGQRVDDHTVLKYIRQMCNSGGGFSQNPQALYPFLHQHGLPVFSNPGLQRAPHSNLQQQLAASLSQKPSQSIGLQQPLQSTGVVQQSAQPNLHQQAAHQLQTAQVARNHQLLQNMMQQQAAVHLQQQQQHQTNKGVLHPLQQQVVVLQQGQATQRQQQQQQQQLLNQQVVHHPQAQQASSQQQQASSAQQIGNQSLTAVSSPQVTNQLKQFQQHQQALLQQQHFQQAVQHLQQQQQLQHHQQEQVQAQAQAQTQAQVQAQAQAHAHIHQHQSSHAPLIQPLVATKPKGLVPLPQQLTKSLSTPALQQGSLLHRHDQLQHGPALSLLRESVQGAAPSNSGDASNHQEDIGELRGSNSNGASKRREFSRASIEQQLSAAVQRVSPSQQAVVPPRPTPTPATELQQSRPAVDVKLFGQSLLCQPASTAATQTASRPPASAPSERTSPVYTTSSSPVTSISAPSATAPKVYGKDSAFRGVPFIPDGRQPQWSNPGLWNIMHAKGSEAELEPEAPSLKIQHMEPQPRIEGLATMVHGLDKPRDQGGASENGRSRSQQPEAFPAAAAAAAAAPPPPQVPRTVINALMAIAEWHQGRNLQSQSQPRLEGDQLESFVRHGLAAAVSGVAVDGLKPHFGGDGGMYCTPPQQHYPNNSSAWTGGPGLVHHPEVQRMLVNPALTHFLPGLSRAPTATEEHLGSATESRDPDADGGGAG